jgi:RNA polymerase sigma factor (sigma-70 family)
MLADDAEAEKERRELLARRLEAVASGDRAAFRLLYGDTAPKLYGVCLRMLKDRETAEDVLQETYATVWAKAGSFDRARAGAMTWLVAVARNKCIDRIRAEGARPRGDGVEAALVLADEAPAADALISRGQDYQRLRRCLEELEPRQANAVRTAFFEGLTYEALAHRQGAPVGTMKSWIRRALIKLRGCLER